MTEIETRERMLDIVKNQLRSLVKYSRRAIKLDVENIFKYQGVKALLIFLFEIILDKMIESHIFSFAHEKNNYSIRVSIEPVIKEPKKNKRYELIPLYTDKKSITPN